MKQQIKLAWQMLRYRKKHVIVLLILMTLSLVLTLLTTILFSSLKIKTEEQNTAQYGEQHATLYDISQQDQDALRANSKVKQVGEIHNYGVWSYDAFYPSTVGYMDESALTMGHLSILEGRMPETANEFVMEKNLQYKIPIAIGDVITLTQDDEVLEITLTGILRDYRTNWNIPDLIETGYTDLPNILLGAPLSMEHPIHMPVLLSKLDDTLPYQIMRDLDYDPYLFVFNDNHYVEGQNLISDLNLFQTLFYIFIVIAFVLFAWIAASFFLNSCKNTYAIFQKLYLPKVWITALFIWQTLWSLLAIPLTILLTLGILTVIPSNMGLTVQMLLYRDPIWKAALVFLLQWLTLFAVYATMMLQQQRPKKLLSFRYFQSIGLQFSLVLHAIKENWKKALFPIAVICGFTLIISVSNLYFEDTFLVETEEISNFTIYPMSGYSSWEYDLFYLPMTQRTAFEKDSINRIAVDGVAGIEHEIETNEAVIVLDDLEHKNYWEQWNMVLNPHDPPKCVPNNITGINDYDVQLLNEEIADYFSPYFSETSEELLSRSTSILLIPEQAPDGFSAPDTLTFMRLEYEGDPFVVIENPDQIKMAEYKIPCTAIVFDPEKTELDRPVLLITPKCFEESEKLFLGYSVFRVWLEPDLSEKQYDIIEQTILQETAPYPDTMYFSLKDDIEQQSEFLAIVKYSASMISIIFAGFAFYMLYIALMLTIQKRKRTIGILNAHGFSIKHTGSVFLLEFLFYAFLLLVLIFVANVILYQRLNAFYLFQSTFLAYFPLYILFVIVICIVSTIQMIYQLSQKSILSSLKFSTKE